MHARITELGLIAAAAALFCFSAPNVSAQRRGSPPVYGPTMKYHPNMAYGNGYGYPFYGNTYYGDPYYGTNYYGRDWRLYKKSLGYSDSYLPSYPNSYPS